jgi:hypothetical protein
VSKGSPTLLEQGAESILPIFVAIWNTVSTETKLNKVAAISSNILDVLSFQSHVAI